MVLVKNYYFQDGNVRPHIASKGQEGNIRAEVNMSGIVLAEKTFHVTIKDLTTAIQEEWKKYSSTFY